jgi:membrane protein DedA with SNARE-associated domain
VSPRRFLVYDALGALISVPIAVSIGYFFGDQIESAIGYLGGFDRLILVIVAVCIIFYGSHLLLWSGEDQRGTT